MHVEPAVNGGRRDRNFDRQFAAPPPYRVRTAYLVVATGFHQVDKSSRDFRFNLSLPLRGRHMCIPTLLAECLTEDCSSAVGGDGVKKLLFPPKRLNVEWEGNVWSSRALRRNSPSTGNLPNCLAKPMYFSSSACFPLQLVRGVPCLGQSITSPQPKMGIPCRHLQVWGALEGLPAWGWPPSRNSPVRGPVGRVRPYPLIWP
jgi:hypothetical protein